jgi:dsDNA-specific endonuclease/ATPase MutS2
MDFSVVESGYDRDEVDRCLADLGEQLARVTAQAESAAEARAELELVRRDAERLHELLKARPAVYRNTFRIQHMVALAEEEAEEILTEARSELDNARRDAERIRSEAYADALNARRDFELALSARRRRASDVEEVLEGVRVEPAASVPAKAEPEAAGPLGEPVPEREERPAPSRWRRPGRPATVR